MANQTIDSGTPTLTFDVGSTYHDQRIQVDSDVMYFRVDVSGWTNVLRVVGSEAHFQRRIVLRPSSFPSGTSEFHMWGSEDWKLESSNDELAFQRYHSASWQDVLVLAYVAAGPDTIRLHADAKLENSSTLVFDQANSSENTIVTFSQSSGGSTVDTSIHKEGWLVCDSAIGVRTKHKTTAPSGGSVGDVVVYTDGSYNSYLMVKTSHTVTAWRGLELNETP